MAENDAFETVRYVFDVSDAESVVVEVPESFPLSETPVVSVIVENVVYFADESGYVMMYPLSGNWSDVDVLHVWSDLPDVPEDALDGRRWAVNARYYDECTYGAMVPEEVEFANKCIASALTTLHQMHRIANSGS